MNDFLQKLFPNKNGKDRPYDLPLHRGNGGWLLSWIIALMTYMIIVSVALFMIVNNISDQWTSGLDGRLTIEINHDIAQRKDTQSNIDEFLQSAENTDGITAQRLSDTDIFSLIEPWFGGALAADDLPLPILIDVEFIGPTNQQQQAMADIQALVDTHIPEARIDTHQQWLNSILAISKTLQLIALTLAMIILFTAIAAILGATKTHLALHEDKVDILHMIGANDSYIAKQFQKQTFHLAAEGSFLGFVFVVITFWSLKSGFQSMEQSFIPQFEFGLLNWIIIALLPYFIALVAMFTSRLTVMRSLKSLV